MKIQIHDFRGVADFTSDIDGFLIVAGPNGAGKSSVCTAIAACLTGDLLPFQGVTKAKAALLVRDGGASASATLTGPDGGASVVWPACERAEKGRAPWASPVAAGLTDPLRMAPKERAAWLIDLIGALPDAETVIAALTEAGVPHSEATTIWTGIEAHGWDAAYAEARETGTKLKGRWEHVAGTKYGSQKASNWRPGGWRSGLDEHSLDELKTLSETKQRQVDEARRASLVHEQQRMDAEERIARRRRALSEEADAKGKALAAQKAEKSAQAARDKLGVSAGRIMHCTECNAAHVMIDGKLVAAPKDAGDPAAIAAADAALKAAHQEAVRAGAHHERLLAEIKAGDEAEEFLKTLPPIPDAAELDRIKAAAAEANGNLDMKRRATEAAELHERIARQIEIVGLLAETGLRQTALVEALGGLASELLDVTRTAGWRPVTVDADMSISYGGRPVSLCSAGEQYRVRAALQIVAARRDGSDAVILDGADILDAPGRNGLMRAVTGMPAVIGMTLKRDDVPAKLIEMGRAVWVCADDTGRMAA